VIGRACFDAPDQIRRRLIRLQSKKNVDVIWHTIDRDKLLIATRYDPRDVFLQFLLALGLNDTCAPGNGEDDVQVDLGVGVGHSRKYMSLLRELINLCTPCL